MQTTVTLEVTLDMGDRNHLAANVESQDFGPKIAAALVAAIPEVVEVEWGGVRQIRAHEKSRASRKE
jgi:hypothetical protein